MWGDGDERRMDEGKSAGGGGGGGGAEPSNDEAERLRRAKLEEALEIKSLRRIISAYLNYPDAAERDVRRYERSFRKLLPSHKGLLSHLPLKYQTLRRCIRANTYFILRMLQAFEPPLDMSQDVYDEDETLDHSVKEHRHFERDPKYDVRNLHPGRTSLPCGDKSLSETQVSTCSGLSCEEVHRSSKNSDTYESLISVDKQGHMGKLQELSEEGRPIPEPGLHVTMRDAGRKNVEIINDQTDMCRSVTNGTIGCHPCDWWDPSLQLNVPLVDVDKVRCIIRNIVRDWASEGEKERDQCYKPILEELVRLFPTRCKERPPTCLVPGAGLGRLALEISRLGFMSQGNEFSYYMMICSSFILNHTQTAGEWTIFPWIHSNCNSFSDSDQLRAVTFPDIHPASAGITEGFCMCGGDFVEVYNDVSQEASWDAVVTCFFLDTAHNIVEYIEIISKILKDGGVWINVGPLLYHFADTFNPEDEMSIELSLEDIKRVVLHYGFTIEVEQIIETTYTTNPRAMMQNRYFAAFWTMKKAVKV